jgi:two-component system phosphate regulon sensor histidine kinase PhoR
VTSAGEIDLDRLLQRFPHAVLALGSDHRIAFANDAARSLLGSDAADFAEQLSQEPGSVTYVRMTTPSGRAIGVTGATANDGSMLVVIEDVTQREQHERALQEFVRNAAHQLRTPLTAITTAVEVLQAGAKDVPGERDRFLEHVARHTARLLRIARGLLALARAQAGEPLRLGPVALETMLARLAGDAEPAPGVEVVTSCAPGLHALGEPNLIEEALAALLDNSVAHTRSGEIRLSASRVADGVSIDVVDTGTGIPTEHRTHVFEPFYRPSPDGDGFGLGLAIAAQAVRAMNGRIEALDEPSGAHLSIMLPAA